MGTCFDCTEAVSPLRYGLRALGAGGAVAELRGLCAERRMIMDTASMTNGDLVDQLAALVDEVLDRCEEYVSGEGDDLEGFAFATKAWNVSLCGSEHRLGRTLGTYRYSLEQRAARRPLTDSSRGFNAFLREHPELADVGGKSAEPSPLEFTDEEVLATLAAFEEEQWASSISRELAHAKRGKYQHTHQDLMRVVAALKRLEKQGRVVQIRQEVYGQRASSKWRAV
jgi:hypothetical protein